MKANFATFANALCHRNATPLSVAVFAPCAWGESVAVLAWQGTTQQRGKCLWAKQTKRKWGSVWTGDFSLSLSLLALFGTPLG